MNKRIVGVVIIALFVVMNAAGLVLGATSNITIGTDDQKDLMEFKSKWCEKELDIDVDASDSLDDFKDGLNEVYELFDANWNTEDADKGKAVQKPTGIDITKIEVKDLDQDKAYYKVSFAGEPKELDFGFMIYLWTNCSGSSTGIITMGVYYPELSGYGEINVFANYYDDETNDTGEMEIDGSTVQIEFDSDEYDSTKDNCVLRCITLTPTEDGSDPEAFDVDIFPGTKASWSWLWWLILILILVIAILAIIYYVRKKSKGSQGSNKPRLKRQIN